MAYYMRLFTKSRSQPSVGELHAAIEATTGVAPVLAIEPGVELNWNQLVVCTPSGRQVCVLERNSRGDGLFEEELGECKDELLDCAPRRGVEWVLQFLDAACATYAVRFLEAGFEDGVQPSPSGVLASLKSILGGIIQADAEGFTNEEGYSVVWQFSDKATGKWNFAVLEDDGLWRTVSFDLSDDQQRQAFQHGTI